MLVVITCIFALIGSCFHSRIILKCSAYVNAHGRAPWEASCTFLHCENYLFLPSEMHIKLFHIHMKDEWMFSAALNLWTSYFFHPLRSTGISNAKVCKYFFLCCKFSLCGKQWPRREWNRTVNLHSNQGTTLFSVYIVCSTR